MCRSLWMFHSLLTLTTGEVAYRASTLSPSKHVLHMTDGRYVLKGSVVAQKFEDCNLLYHPGRAVDILGEEDVVVEYIGKVL